MPPFWEVNFERLEDFLAALPRGRQYAFELRNASWFTEDVYGLLRRHNAAFCIYDLAGFHTDLVLTANFAYVRLHGPGGKYQGSYDDSVLYAWANRIRDWQRELHAIYVYFDNDQSAFAVANALALKSALR